MVANEFESKVLDFMLRSEKFMGEELEFRNTAKSDIETIKTNVKDLCGRTTTLETDKQIKNHSNYIKILGVLFGGLGVSSIISLLTSMHLIKN